MDSRVSARIDGALRSATEQPFALVGLAAARIGVGAAQLSLFLSDYAERRVLFGPESFYPRGDVGREGGFNLFVDLGDGVATFEVVYHLGILLCVAMVLGFGGRLVVLGAWAVCWTMWGANPFMIDGGDNLSMVVMPLLAASRCCERLSIRTSWAPLLRVRALGASWWATLVSNAAALAIALQICLVYLMSGLYKAQGDMWVDGTALYYVMRTPEYFHPALSPLVLDHDHVIVLGTYGAMLALIAFPFLVISRSVRPWAVAVMVLFHLSIAVFMGLTSFALVMIACDTIFVSSHIEGFVRWLRDQRDDDTAVPDRPAAEEVRA
jgi:antimicrobial peptide system SdpB family protein